MDKDLLSTALPLAALRLRAKRLAGPFALQAKHAQYLEDLSKNAHIRGPHSDEQRAFIECRAPRTIIRAGRRFGKTVGVSIIAATEFFEGHRVLYATPTSEQIEAFWSEITAAFADIVGPNMLRKNETEHSIELPGTKVRIRAKTAWNADTLRGDYADVLILDEWQLMDESAWNEVGAPMLLDNNGRAIFVYTPPSLHSRSVTKARDPRHAAKMFKRALADDSGRWRTFSFSSHMNPMISAAALADITNDMTELAYKQEIMAEDVETVPGALWKPELITKSRVDTCPDLVRIVIGVDPPGGATECGIVAAGASADGHAYIIADASLKASPDAWAGTVIDLYQQLGANIVAVEKNYGGDMVMSTLVTAANSRDLSVYCHPVNATRGKAIRAEPVVARFEQGRVHLVGSFPYLEEELQTWDPIQSKQSPNRLDACLVAGTMVLTDRGNIPIESVVPGMCVMTRKGSRMVLKAGMTKENADVQQFVFTGNRILVGTQNHPVFTYNRGFIPLGQLNKDDIVECFPQDHWRRFAKYLGGLPNSQVAPVYNLEVAEEHEYYANGILVHNCVWAITELMPFLMGGMQRATSDVSDTSHLDAEHAIKPFAPATASGVRLAGYRASRWKSIRKWKR